MPETKVILITGASMGLGHAMAELLTEDGWTVFGTSREPENYSTHGWEMIELDVTDDASVRECVDGVMERAGRIDALVNNAGYGLSAMTEEASLDEIRTQFDTNYLGVHRMCRAVLPIMREQGGGRIVNISSLVGLIAPPEGAHYAATKHALEAYSQAMRFEVAQFDIHVSVVEPGLTKSRFRKNVAKPDEPLAVYDSLRARLRAKGARAEENAQPTAVVPSTVRRVLRARNPRLRYTCTLLDWTAAHLICWLPESVMHWIVRKVFGV
ncbi:MAG: SDR family NAD(P)-dependent oxidoreductase [Armatimonadia bacterium]|nr:SDR family NAD(P)-dependent oxidoreductase [Armatimonadia bacterium]